MIESRHTRARAAMAMIQSAARNSRMILPASPMPAQMMTSGIRARGGTGRMNSTIGSNQPRNQFDSADAVASGHNAPPRGEWN